MRGKVNSSKRGEDLLAEELERAQLVLVAAGVREARARAEVHERQVLAAELVAAPLDRADALLGSSRDRADPDRRVGPAHGLRTHVARVEAEVPAVEGGWRLGPREAQHLDRLRHPRHALREADADRLRLVGPVARAHSEDDAPARDVV